MQSLRIVEGKTSPKQIKKTYEGWTLLLAVRPDQVEAARECVLPLLRPYGCYYTWFMSVNPKPFTIISLKRIGLEISRFSRPEIYVTPGDVKIMIRQLEAALNLQGVGPNDPQLPGFTKTRSPYFFLANLDFQHDLLPLSLDYKKRLEEAGVFNPLHTPNPYQEIMADQSNADIADYFFALPKSCKETLLSSLQVVLLGFLRTHTTIDELSVEEKEVFTRECFTKNKKLPPKFVKTDTVASEQDIKTAGILFEWSLSEHKNEIIVVNSLNFPATKEFSKLINDYNYALRAFLSPEVSSTSITLKDFMQSQGERLSERWVLAECGVRKENEESIPCKIKNKLPDMIANNDCEQLSIAIKILKEKVNIHFYHDTLLGLKRHPLVQLELADLLINDYDKLNYERPLTYKGLTYLKEALKQASPEIESVIAAKVEQLWKDLNAYDIKSGGFFAKKQKGPDLLVIMLKELVIVGCSLAKFMMARFLCRDLAGLEVYHEGGKCLGNNIFDHQQAENYFYEVIEDKTVSEEIKSLCRDYLNRLQQIKKESESKVSLAT